MDIREVSLRYLTYRNRTVSEMKAYLEKKEFNEDEINAEIETLKALRYLNDIEYAQMYFRYSFGKNRGIERTKRELMDKGISEFDFEDAVSEYEEENNCNMEEEKDRALKAGKKIMTGVEISDKSLGKLARRLKTLGYNASTIYDVVGHFMRSEDGNIDYD